MLVVIVGLDKAGSVLVGPEIISAGFADLPEGSALFDGARALIVEILGSFGADGDADRSLVKQRIRSALRKFLQRAIDRRPMILPVIIDV